MLFNLEKNYVVDWFIPLKAVQWFPMSPEVATPVFGD